VTDGTDAGPVVNHVGLCVAELGRARRFYEHVLGFRFDRELQVPDRATAVLLGVEPPVNLTAVYLQRGSFVLELLHFDRAGNPGSPVRPFNEPGLTHLSVAVDDLDAVLALVPQHGGEVAVALPGVAVVRDPDGQLIELLPMSYRQQLG
jgi:lactoylglutathione lyase